jgi:hypothetical protein
VEGHHINSDYFSETYTFSRKLPGGAYLGSYLAKSTRMRQNRHCSCRLPGGHILSTFWTNFEQIFDKAMQIFTFFFNQPRKYLSQLVKRVMAKRRVTLAACWVSLLLSSATAADITAGAGCGTRVTDYKSGACMCETKKY